MFWKWLLVNLGCRESLDQDERCYFGYHKWPAPFYGTSINEKDPTECEEAKINLEENERYKILVEAGMVMCYIQKGLQRCQHPGCFGVRKVFRILNINVFSGGGPHEWEPLTKEIEAKIDALPSRGENPVLNSGIPGVGFRCSYFSKTEAVR